MLIKRMPFRAANSQRACDVGRHVRYLLAGHARDDSAGILMRLAGPPYCRHLVQRIIPFGTTYRDAAKDIGRQLYLSVRKGCIASAMPRQIYAHIVFSYAPRYRSRSALGFLAKEGGEDAQATYSGALRIALDALAMLGVETCFPLYLVVHVDAERKLTT